MIIYSRCETSALQCLFESIVDQHAREYLTVITNRNGHSFYQMWMEIQLLFIAIFLTVFLSDNKSVVRTSCKVVVLPCVNIQMDDRWILVQWLMHCSQQKDILTH